MDKKVIIINGRGGVGKDTLIESLQNEYHVLNISAIDPIKKIAFQNGYDGGKSDKDRKFLSDLKKAFIEYNDLPNKYLIEKYHEFLMSDYFEVLFVHIREPEEIDKFKELVPLAKTLLIYTNDDKVFNNDSDNNVEDYNYDFKYDNSHDLCTLEESKKCFLKFFRNSIMY